ncbi:hypothetical protein SDC9_128662 [bioreactor metagenome]|uniref:Uncharacterized protein n=1 Tax=bioreactor metagenome TaxID=1076179 RepID=A0A645CWV2_9ZZZZ
MKPCVRVGTADGFLQGGEDIVMAVPVPVIPHGRALGHHRSVLHGDDQLSLPPFGRAGQQLQSVDRLAHVTAAGRCDMLKNAFLKDDRGSHPLFHESRSPADGAKELPSAHRLEFKNGGPAQNRVIDVKVRVFRGGGDEGDLPIFHEFQQGLLLLLVEVLDFVQIEQHSLGSHDGADVPDDILDVGDGGGGGV